MKLHSQILIGLAAGIVVAAGARWLGLDAITGALVAVEPVGTMFIRAIAMVVIPLVVASVFVSLASLGDLRSLGRMGGWTMAYFAVTTLLAATIGAVTAGVTTVGRGATLSSPQPVEAHATAAPLNWVEQIVDLVPQNPIKAAADGDLLPLIVAVCLFGAAATAVSATARQPLVAVLSSVSELTMVLIGWIMRLAPVAVFILIGAAVSRFGAGVLYSLAAFVGVVVAALLVHVVAVLLPSVVLIARVRLDRFLRSVSDALILAFSTASSSATLPVTMANAATLGVPPRVSNFLLPLGSTVNKNGAAVYKAVTAIFLARVYGLHIGPTEFVAVILASTMAAFAGAGVPGSSLVTTMIVLNAIGLRAEAAAGIALVAGVDRPLDMCRTTVNTLSNLVGAAVVGRKIGPART